MSMSAGEEPNPWAPPSSIPIPGSGAPVPAGPAVHAPGAPAWPSSMPPSLPRPATTGRGELPAPPGVLRSHIAAHPRRTDWTLAALYAAPLPFTTLLLMAVRTSSTALLPQLATVLGHIALTLGFAVSIATVRRTRPWIPLAIAALAIVTSWSVSLAPIGDVAAWLALYGLAVYRSGKAAWGGLGIVAAAHAIGIAVFASNSPTDLLVGSLGGMGLLALDCAATAIGVNVGNRTRYLRALRERAEALARERDQSARLAAVEERSRIAREMHDVVAHSLTVIVTLADGAAAMIDKSPERSREAMEQVSKTGRQAVTEMRRMLGVLRTDEAADGEAPRLPQPGVAQLVELTEEFRSLDLPVSLELSGQVPDDAALQLAVYRIVQEGLTNALRYADRATRVEAQVRALDGRIEVRVRDNGRPLDTASQATGHLGTGHGLAGIRERAAAYGGLVEAGPVPDGGWELYAELPAEIPTSATHPNHDEGSTPHEPE